MNDSFYPAARRCRRSVPLFLAHAAFVAGMAASRALGADTDMPNIDHCLRQFLSSGQERSSATVAPTTGIARPRPATNRLATRDADGRVLVDIHLNGKASIDIVRSQLTAAGAKIVAENSAYRRGVMSAFVPVNKVAEMAGAPGVLSMSLTRRPRTNIGATTSEGVFVIHSDVLNAMGFDGTGQTVGVLSDSYDTAQTDTNGNPLTIHAANDVATGDLPGTGNPQNPNPVVVLEDFAGAPDNPVGDEGRAMLQIVHDVAPKAKLAFATASISKVDFANNIRRLRTQANCDVLVDDIVYTEEPMFSDGLIAQAVDDVVTSSVLAGPKCAYFAAAGNYEGGGYASDFRPVSDAIARAGLPNQNLKLNQVPAALTSGGFHNFNTDPAGPIDISQQFTIDAGDNVEFDLQWNDPFDLPSGVTTDYNILIFDANGNFLADFSGTNNNFMTQEPLEDVFLNNPGDSADYQIAITRAGNVPATPVARKLRYLAIGINGGIGANEYYDPKAPTTFGHCCAKGAVAVAAYGYTSSPTNPPAPPFFPFYEDGYSSAGPSTIDFDAAGNRLAQSEIRLKPEVAAPDLVDNTFFGTDYEGNGFPNFSGTSAAAPHAAGLAALLLQKAGGPVSLTLAQLRNILETSVSSSHDLDPFFCRATTVPTRNSRRTRFFSGGTVTVTGCGNANNGSARDPNFFTINFSTVTRGETLNSVEIDLTNAGLKFDTTTATGFPLTLGRLVNIRPSNIIWLAGPPFSPPSEQFESIPSITLVFARGTFTSATSVSFGIDRDVLGDGGGNNADYLEGAVVSASTSRNVLEGVFANSIGFGFSFTDGFGLIDGQAAAQKIPLGGARTGR